MLFFFLCLIYSLGFVVQEASQGISQSPISDVNSLNNIVKLPKIFTFFSFRYSSLISIPFFWSLSLSICQYTRPHFKHYPWPVSPASPSQLPNSLPSHPPEVKQEPTAIHSVQQQQKASSSGVSLSTLPQTLCLLVFIYLCSHGFVCWCLFFMFAFDSYVNIKAVSVCYDILFLCILPLNCFLCHKKHDTNRRVRRRKRPPPNTAPSTPCRRDR